MTKPRAMVPKREADDPCGRRRDRKDELRELDLLDQLALADDRGRRVGDRGGEPLPGKDRREDEQRVVRWGVPDDDRQEHEIDDHLEQRVEDPPDVAEQGVRTALADVRLDEVAHEPLARPDVVDALAQEPEDSSIAGGIAKACRDLTRGGHRAEGYHLPAAARSGRRGSAPRTGRSLRRATSQAAVR